MKKLLLLLFLIPNLVMAETYTNNNVKIGGMSIFDNLYDHLTPKMVREGKKGYEDYYKHLKNPLKFPTVAITNHPTINKKYKQVEINYKSNNGQLIIHSISGGEFYNNINLCYKDMNILVENVSQKFPNSKKEGPITGNLIGDSSGKSSGTEYSFYINDDYEINIACNDWSEKRTRIDKWKDNLLLTVYSNDFVNWIQN